jgi:hypothetical protein
MCQCLAGFEENFVWIHCYPVENGGLYPAVVERAGNAEKLLNSSPQLVSQHSHNSVAFHNPR